MEAPAEKAKEPDLGAASTAAAISRLRSERSVRLEAEAPATQPGSVQALSRSMSRGPSAVQTFFGLFAQPSFREKPKIDETPDETSDKTPDAGQADPRALELLREAPRSQPPPAPLARSLSASREIAPSPATPTSDDPGSEVSPVSCRRGTPCGRLRFARAGLGAGVTARVSSRLGARGSSSMGRAPSLVAAQAAGDSQGKPVQFL